MPGFLNEVPLLLFNHVVFILWHSWYQLDFMNFCLNVLMTGTPDKGMGYLRPISSQEKIFWICQVATALLVAGSTLTLWNTWADCLHPLARKGCLYIMYAAAYGSFQLMDSSSSSQDTLGIAYTRNSIHSG